MGPGVLSVFFADLSLMPFVFRFFFFFMNVCKSASNLKVFVIIVLQETTECWKNTD